jgi:hypothetical protein
MDAALSVPPTYADGQRITEQAMRSAIFVATAPARQAICGPQMVVTPGNPGDALIALAEQITGTSNEVEQ